MSFLTTQDVDPSLVNSIADNATNSDKQDALALQLKLAGQLRNKQPDHGTMAGALYIPPNPINQALDNIDHFQGISDSMHGADKQNELINQRGAALHDFIGKYMGQDKKTVTDPKTGLMSLATDDPLSGAGVR